MKHVSFHLKPLPPYDFSLTAGAATYFQNRYGVDIFEGGVYRRLLEREGRLGLVSVSSIGDVESPCLKVRVIGWDTERHASSYAAEQVAWLLGTDQDLAPFYHLSQGDPILGPLVEAMPGLHIPRTGSVYEGLIMAILGQQISSNAARVMRRLLIEKYGPAFEIDGVTYRGFPRPEDLAGAGVEGLCKLKLSARKAQYIWGITEAVAASRLDLEGLKNDSDELAIKKLLEIRGVGLWTVHWLLVRSLGRQDGFPHSDLALCRILGQILRRGSPLSPHETLEYSRRWSPYRSYVTNYLFAAMRSGYFCFST
ncbi:MAG: AlkA N-terminal domain-containing protein [Pseudomonadota bacterium]